MKSDQLMTKTALLCCWLLQIFAANAQQIIETDSQKPMPDEWIDKDTHHKITRISRLNGRNASFYFHNNPFIDNAMVFYNTGPAGKQLYLVDLNTLQSRQLTHQASNMSGEIVAPKGRNIFYQCNDSVFSTNIDTKETRLVFVFPPDYKASITTINADETMLAGNKASDKQKDILRMYPEKSKFFDRIYDAKLPNDLFTINLKTKELKKVHQENTWLGHVQFSPADPHLLMFCHEGPWHKVDRIWQLNIQTGKVKLMHKRSMENEIAGHEFFGPDGKMIWFDLQLPRGVTFYLAGADVNTGKEIRYQMTRDEWSIHFNISPDQKLFAGDGGNDTQVAKAKDGMWIYLFHPEGDLLRSERLVNMKHHGYKLEPNVHFSPDGKHVIFRANFGGDEQVYAVEVKKSGRQTGG